MKAGDIVVCKRELVLVKIESMAGRGFSGCRVVRLFGLKFIERMDLDEIRPLTPEELAAYALGWRGPAAQEPAS